MIFLIDTGHGGILSGSYQTAPAKMFKHESHGVTAYEGVTNRLVGDIVLKEGEKAGLKLINISPSLLDIPLKVRVDFANSIARQYGSGECLLLSLHSNAGGGSGFELFTTKGETLSDKYARLLAQRFEKTFPNIRVRKDLVDGDADKEAEFYIQKNTICPSVLLEWLFFDNWEDYKIISSPFEQMRYAKFIIDFCIEVSNN